MSEAGHPPATVETIPNIRRWTSRAAVLAAGQPAQRGCALSRSGLTTLHTIKALANRYSSARPATCSTDI